MTARTVPPQTRASDLKLSDWVHAYDLHDDLEGVAEVIFTQPYNEYGTTGVTILLSFGDQTQPQPVHVRLDRLVRVATADEIADARLHALRSRVGEQLRELARLIEAGTIPIPDGQLHIAENVGDVNLLAAVAEKLGVEVHKTDRDYQSFNWPGGRRPGEDGLTLTLYAYAQKPVDDYAARGVDEEQTGEPVPEDVEGYSNAERAGEIRQVSAPPATGGE